MFIAWRLPGFKKIEKNAGIEEVLLNEEDLVEDIVI